MSSPNSKAYAFAIKGAFTSSSSATAAAGSKLATLSIGKDSHRIPITKMVCITSPSWEKQACFNRLTAALRGQLNSHSVTDLVTATAEYLPIETTAAFEEAMTVERRIENAATDVNHLDPVAFLDSNGKVVEISGTEPADRPADIRYVRLTCTISGTNIDDRITQGKFSTDFCLKLPQSRRNIHTGEITALTATTPAHTVTTPKKKSSLFRTSKDVLATVFDITTPKKNRLFSKFTSSSDEVTSWFGNPDLLDDADVFAREFGTSTPQLFPPQPVTTHTSDSTNSAYDGLHRYAQKCMFDVFLHTCQIDYVGSGKGVDSILAVQEVCTRISELKQQFRNKHGKMDIMSPDELFNMYLQLVPSLPDDTSTWTGIQLGSSFFNALIDELKNKMLQGNFRMPPSVHPTTKQSELKILRTVREAASESFKKLSDDITLFDRMMGNRQGSKHHASQSIIGKTFFHSVEESAPLPPATATTQDHTQHGQLFLYQRQSPAEQTLARYKSPSSSNQPHNPHNLPTRKGSDNLLYPYRLDDPNYTSKYPLGFRGCFKCGRDDHFNLRDCPQRDVGTRREFWKELWIHKPHTKRQDSDRNQTRPQVRSPRMGFYKLSKIITIIKSALSFKASNHPSHRHEIIAS